MATLEIDVSDYSATKQKALEDARVMQASIVKECTDAGTDLPPYVFSELIGKGSFGRVYKATATGTKPGKLVSIKVISIEAGDSLYPGAADTFGDILKEINTLKLLGTTSAKNINTIIDALLIGQSMWIVTEYCAGGSVASLMRPTGGLPEKWIIPILREVAEAIYWVHKQGIIHRDIKCANVLITDTGDVQLCDFGVAGIIETKFDKRSTVTGTLHWMAPEFFDSSVSYGSEVDIWAFGSMAYEVASGLPPNATTTADIPHFGAYLKQRCVRLEGDQYSPQLKDFISQCMVVDPLQRPTIEKVQKHPYIFKTVDNYPTASLLKLINAYKLWEMHGGSRRSLFSQGGAQGPTDYDSPVPKKEWNFAIMDDLDQPAPDEADAEAIYDAYYPRISFPPPVSSSQRRRRRPANMKAPTVPLEKAFDPNTLSNYKDAVRAFYSKTSLPSTPGLPLRDNSNHLTLRESLIDLDASLNCSELSRFADVETIKVRAQPLTSDMADLDRRRTQDWTFPATAPASASLDMPPFQFEGDDAPMRYMTHSTQLYLADDLAADYPASQVTPSAPSGRDSMLSLIDLDASLPSFMVDAARPSTVGSDTASAGSDASDTPFDLEPQTFKSPPASREPSIYVMNHIGSHREPSTYVSGDTYLHCSPENLRSDSHSTPVGRSRDSTIPRAASEPSTELGGVLALSPPNPPSEDAMQGISSQDEVKDELRRMISSLSEHLQPYEMPLKSVLITGCGSAGIGTALATEFHMRGHRVFATGISETQLAHLAALGMETFEMDVTSGPSIESGVARVMKATASKLDILINNAGVMHILPFADTDVADARKVFEVNVLGVFAVTKAFLPLLIEAAKQGGGDSVVASIGSINSVFRPPFLGPYNASKAAVECLGASIRTEIAPLGVRVVTIKTGSVKSDLFNNAPPTKLPEGSLYHSAKEFIEGRKMLDGEHFMKPEVYAKNVVDELLRPKVKHVIWQGGLTTIAWLLSWFGWEGIMDSTLIKGHQLDRI
ncbi:hypothetical protein HD806DRAFT_458058 [Xylariaceae sp. AK1471]|nr:hypothetical protein HD806DRAFT_458058 [Xylariaceae sp. AK1471]